MYNLRDLQTFVSYFYAPMLIEQKQPNNTKTVSQAYIKPLVLEDHICNESL